MSYLEESYRRKKMKLHVSTPDLDLTERYDGDTC